MEFCRICRQTYPKEKHSKKICQTNSWNEKNRVWDREHELQQLREKYHVRPKVSTSETTEVSTVSEPTIQKPPRKIASRPPKKESKLQKFIETPVKRKILKRIFPKYKPKKTGFKIGPARNYDIYNAGFGPQGQTNRRPESIVHY